MILALHSESASLGAVSLIGQAREARHTAASQATHEDMKLSSHHLCRSLFPAGLMLGISTVPGQDTQTRRNLSCLSLKFDIPYISWSGLEG